MADEAAPEGTDDTGQQPPAPAQEQQQPPATEEPQGTDWQAEARKWETRAKENFAAKKELDDRKAAEMTETQKAQAAAQDASDKLAAAERKTALLQAAVDHGLDADALDLLDGIPADQIDAKAKKLAERIKAATPAGKSGGEVGGTKNTGAPSTLQGALTAHLGQ